MKKYFTRGLLAVFLVSTVFVFSAFTNVTPASAQSTDICQLIDLLMTIPGIIKADQVDAVNAFRTARGCPIIPVVVSPVVPPTATTTQNLPTAVITSSPTLQLTYDSAGKESTLTAKFKASITATGGDVTISTQPFTVGLINTTNNNNNSVRSARTVSTAVNLTGVDKGSIDGKDVYIIHEGVTANFNITFVANTSELFAGAYFARLYGVWLPEYKTPLNISPVTNASYMATIIGETSPYISGVETQVNADGKKVLVVSGVRLSNTDPILKCGDKKFDSHNVDTVSDSVGKAYFNINALPAGFACSVQLSHAKTGNSNLVGFTVPGSTTEKPSITILSPNGGEILVQNKQYSNEYSISWRGSSLSGVYAFLVSANSDGYGSGSLGIIGYVSSSYSTMGWDGMTVWTDLHNGQEIKVPSGSYKIYLVGDVANVTGKVVRDMSNSYFKIVAKDDGSLYPEVTLNEPSVDGLTVIQNGVAKPVSGEINTAWCKNQNPNAKGNGPFEFNWGDNSKSCSWFPATHTYLSATGGDKDPYRIEVRVKNTAGLISSRSNSVVVSPIPFIPVAPKIELTAVSNSSTNPNSNNYIVTSNVDFEKVLFRVACNSSQIEIGAKGGMDCNVDTTIGFSPTKKYTYPLDFTSKDGAQHTVGVLVAAYKNGAVIGTAKYGQTVVPIPAGPKEYSQTFSGTVDGEKIFDFSEVVTGASATLKWTDDGKSCKGQIKISADGNNWTLKKDWTDVESPATFTFKNLGNIRYMKFLENNCSSYTIKSLDVVGISEVASVGTGMGNTATALIGFDSILRLIKALR